MILDPQTFVFFLAAVLVLLLTPGPNMLYVLTSGAAHGWRGGVAAAAGIGVVDLIFTLACALGLAGLVTAYPAAFDLIRWAGAAYLLTLAFACVRSAQRSTGRSTSVDSPETAPPSNRAIFVRGLGSNLANPKAILFYLVFIPQFIDAGRGPVLAQFVLLGSALAIVGVLFHGMLGAFAAAASSLAGARPGMRRGLYYAQATLFALIALRLLFG